MKGQIAVCVALLSMPVVGGPTQAKDEVRQCPDPTKLRGICSMVSNHEKDPTPHSSFEYLYERKVYEAACLNYERDSDDLIRNRVSALMNSSQERLMCQGANFDLTEGNILKFAINGRTFGLIDKAIDEWGMDLNWIDASDSQTLLDYARRQLEKNRNSPLEVTLKNYHDKIRRAGGKYRHELP